LQIARLLKVREVKNIILLVLGLSFLFNGCTDSEVASKNISKASDMFQINRRVVFYNGITDKYILSVEGFCSIEKDKADNQLEVTCKIGNDQYKKHYLGISDNVTYFVEQLNDVNVSAYHYKVIFKPTVIVPDLKFKK